MAKPYASNRLDKSRVYWLLIAGSLLAFLDPWQLTDPLRDVAQILVPAQYTVFSATSRIRESFGQASAGLSDFDHDGDVDQDDWIALEAAHRSLVESQGRLVDTIRLWQTNAAELRRERDAALNLRPGEASRDFRFIPARIVAADVMAMRDRAIVDKGNVGGAERSRLR